MQPSQAQAAVRGERTHLESLGLVEGLPVRRVHCHDVRRRAAGVDVGEQAPRVGLLAGLLPLLAYSGLAGVLASGVATAGEEMRLTEPREPGRMVGDEPHRPGALDRLLQKRHRGLRPSLERVTRRRAAL